jgi:hypothetical protein
MCFPTPSMTINMNLKTPPPAQRSNRESAPTSPPPTRPMNMKTSRCTSIPNPQLRTPQAHNSSPLIITVTTTTTRQPLLRHLHPLLLAIKNSSLLRIIRQFHPHQLPLLRIQIIKLPCLLALWDIIMDSSSPMAGDLRCWQLDWLTVAESFLAVEFFC